MICLSRIGFFFSLLIFQYGCTQLNENREKDNFENEKSLYTDTTSVKHSRLFSIHYHNTFKVVYIYKDESQKDTLFKYLLCREDTKVPEKFQNAERIHLPITKIVSLSSLYVAYLNELQLLDNLVAVDNVAYISNPSILDKVKQNKIQEVGSNNYINTEKLASIMPQLVFSYTADGYNISPKLKELGIPVVFTIDHLESTPLGRAEWIKLMAIFFNKEKEVNIFFDSLEYRYNKLTALTKDITNQPTVFTGIKLGDGWYMPAGKSYMSQLFHDAGADYLWKDDSTTGSLKLSFETVLEKANTADYWLNVITWNSLDEALKNDIRYRYFKAYQQHKIFNNNARVNAMGGNDFWESGLMFPDVVLADLIKIFHPQLLPNHQLVYYKKLE